MSCKKSKWDLTVSSVYYTQLTLKRNEQERFESSYGLHTSHKP